MRIAITVITALVCVAPEASAQSADDWFGADKALHFTASAVIAGGGYALGAALFDDTWPRVTLGVGVGLAAGVGKELVDLAGYGDPSWRDLTWDALGVGVGALAAWGVDMAVRALRAPPPQPVDDVCPLPGRHARWTLTPTLTSRGASLTLAW